MHVLIIGPMPVIDKFARFSTHINSTSKVYQLIHVTASTMVVIIANL